MSWNYRLIAKDGLFAFHEAYYDDAGEVTGWTVLPVTVSGSTIADVEWTLERMLADLRRHPPFTGDEEHAKPRLSPG